VHTEFLFFENTKISIFVGILKISQTYCLWVGFGRFWQFWAAFATLPMAENSPELQAEI
jgi:hypothetical protein